MNLKISKVNQNLELCGRLSVQGVDDLHNLLKVNLLKLKSPTEFGVVFTFEDNFKIMVMKSNVDEFKVSSWKNNSKADSLLLVDLISVMEFVFLHTLTYECV
jgi:hypothetical protein